MFKLKIVSVGKPKNLWVEEGVKTYVHRLRSVMSIDFVYLKNNEQLLLFLKKQSLVICLDPLGEILNSRGFSKKIHRCFQEGGSRLTIAIGGAEGLPEEARKKYSLLSLSSMTLTHQMARLFLLEQLYRATEIAKGSAYHK